MRDSRPGMSLIVTAEGLILGKECAVDEESVGEGDNGNARRQSPLWTKQGQSHSPRHDDRTETLNVSHFESTICKFIFNLVELEVIYYLSNIANQPTRLPK